MSKWKTTLNNDNFIFSLKKSSPPCRFSLPPRVVENFNMLPLFRYSGWESLIVHNKTMMMVKARWWWRSPTYCYFWTLLGGTITQVTLVMMMLLWWLRYWFPAKESRWQGPTSRPQDPPWLSQTSRPLGLSQSIRANLVKHIHDHLLDTSTISNDPEGETRPGLRHWLPRQHLASWC